MGYRLPDERPDGCRRLPMARLWDVANGVVLSVDNGTICHVLVPCGFEGIHDRPLHDHLGWPSPDHRDRSCQLPHEVCFEQVDLSENGYDSIEVILVDPPSGLSVTGAIDNGSVALTVSSMCESAQSEDVDVTMAVYAIGRVDAYLDYDAIDLRDVVMKGTIHIVAGPIRSA